MSFLLFAKAASLEEDMDSVQEVVHPYAAVLEF